MSEEAQRDALTLFATSKPNGTGFGLPLAVKIVESEHGGRLTLESNEGSRNSRANHCTGKCSNGRGMKERHLALMVEDDPETAEDLVQILESVDCGSVVVDNAEDAEKRLQEKSFCLILLDLQIKKRSGLDKRSR